MRGHGSAGALAVLVCCVVAGCGASSTLYGVEAVQSCLVLNGADVSDLGAGYVRVNDGGSAARKATGMLRFFHSASAARLYSARLRRTSKSNPVWTLANVSLLGTGSGIYRVVKPCLGSKERVSPQAVMARVPRPLPVVVGNRAEVLPARTLAQGWETIGRGFGRGHLRLRVHLRSRRFKAFAVSLKAPPGIDLRMFAVVGCVGKNGGGMANPVWYTGGTPVVLRLDSNDCSHRIAPDLWVDVRSGRDAKDLLISAQLVMRR